MHSPPFVRFDVRFVCTLSPPFVRSVCTLIALSFGSHSPTSLPDPSCTLPPVVVRELSTESRYTAFLVISTAVGWAGAPAAAFLQQQQ